MEKKTLTCISCPLGCQVTVTLEEGQILSVTGNTCKRGEVYARKEITNPTRIVTSTVPITGGEIARLPVKTLTAIPKGKMFDCVLAMKQICVQAPVTSGQVILPNVADTGVDLVATRCVRAGKTK